MKLKKITAVLVLLIFTSLSNAQQSLVYAHENADFKRAKELFTAKKYVAAQQQWKCNNCASQLTHTFEVDHKVDLRYGGTNHVSNLVALCRNCHGEKTMQNKLE